MEVATGCDNCYAASLAHRFGYDVWGSRVPRRLVRSSFNRLDKMQLKAAKLKEKHMVFIGSMMDIFETDKPLTNNHGPLEFMQSTDQVRRILLGRISQRMYPDLYFQFLTKRPQNISKMIPFSWRYGHNLPKNVWFGTSASTQEEYEKYTKWLIIHTPKAAKLFLSLEPQIEEIHMRTELFDKVRWVIVGGESGPKARPFDPAWVRTIFAKCQQQGVAVFLKQLGTVWAKQSGTYGVDSKGSNPEFWAKALARQQKMVP